MRENAATQPRDLVFRLLLRRSASGRRQTRSPGEHVTVLSTRALGSEIDRPQHKKLSAKRKGTRMFLGFTVQQWLSFGVVSVAFNLVFATATYAFRNRRKALALLSAIEFEFRFARQLCTAYKADSANGT